MISIAEWNLGSCLAIYIDRYCEYDVAEQYYEKSCYKMQFIENNTLKVWNGLSNAIFFANESEFDGIATGDVISVNEHGYLSILYETTSGDVDVFITNKCNSNCVMCPLAEGVRRKNEVAHEEWVREYIDILPDDVDYINITGGEPTLPQIFFLEIMEIIKAKFQYSEFQLLTNGRSLADKVFWEKVENVIPRGIRFAIPIHSSNAELHDAITQTKGSFAQTDRGIKNLLYSRQKVEIRVVVSRKNLNSLFDTAKYIIDNYKGVYCVNFIGMEMMGNAALNRNELWVDYRDAFLNSKEAIDILVKAGIDVQLYNFPLCAVDRGYWHIAAKSITDYKIRYMDECEKCDVKEICGGFFYSTKQVMNPRVSPIRKQHED